MDISVVINCSNDFHVFKTIDSIDEEVEIICSITPNTEIETRLQELKIPYVITKIGSQSKTTNAGINLVSNDKFILMDSDCYFERGFIKQVFNLLDNNLVVNGNIKFDHIDTLLSKTIAKCKSFDNTFEDFAHKPGLGLRKELIKYIGDYWFNSILPWSEDSELSYRITKAGINIYHGNELSIHHLPTTYKHNLVSCYRYGGGDYLRHKILNQQDSASLIEKYKIIINTFSWFEMIVMLSNDISYQLGYSTTNLKHILRNL